MSRAWAIAFAFAAARLAYVGAIQLAPDEAYYWEWSRSLDWSYYDQGPMLALAIRLGTALFGHTELGVRLGAVLCGLGVSGAFIWMAGILGAPQAAAWLVLAANSMLLYSVGAVLMMHDSLLALFWSLALAFALKATSPGGRLGSGGGHLWLACGLACGAACLSKYTGLLLPLSLLLALATHPALRPQLRSPWLWAGALAGGGLAGGPILGWNYAHGWPSFQHVGSLAGGDASRRSLSSLPEFLLSQAALVTPLLLWLLLLALAALWRQRRQADPARWLLFCASAPALLFFTALSLRSRVEGNWPAPAYLGALALGGLWLAEQGALASRRARGAWVLALALALLAHGQAAWGILPLPSAHAPRLDSTARLAGWRELAERVQAERAKLGTQAFVGCRTYQNAAELAFYLPDHPRPLILQKGSINHQYRFWNQPAAFRGRDAVLVVGQEWELNEMREMFASVSALPDQAYHRRGVEMRRTRLYLGRGFRPWEG